MRGLSEKEIATNLFMSTKNVKFHKTQMYKELGAKNMTHAALLYAASVSVPLDFYLSIDGEAVKAANKRFEKVLKNGRRT